MKAKGFQESKVDGIRKPNLKMRLSTIAKFKGGTKISPPVALPSLIAGDFCSFKIPPASDSKSLFAIPNHVPLKILNVKVLAPKFRMVKMQWEGKPFQEWFIESILEFEPFKLFIMLFEYEKETKKEKEEWDTMVSCLIERKLNQIGLFNWKMSDRMYINPNHPTGWQKKSWTTRYFMVQVTGQVKSIWPTRTDILTCHFFFSSQAINH